MLNGIFEKPKKNNETKSVEKNEKSKNAFNEVIRDIHQLGKNQNFIKIVETCFS